MLPHLDAGLVALSFAFLAGTVATVLLARAAGALNLVDHPGGRKTHARPVPLVGGLAIFIALLGVAALTGIADNAAYFLFALSIVIAVGLWDDVTDISARGKFGIQIVASCLMFFGPGVGLT